MLLRASSAAQVGVEDNWYARRVELHATVVKEDWEFALDVMSQVLEKRIHDEDLCVRLGGHALNVTS